MKFVLFLCILPQFLYASGIQRTWPRAPKCTCTVNVPPAKRLGKSSSYGANGNVVKRNALLNLQKNVEEIREELAKLRTGSPPPVTVRQCSRREMDDNRESGVLMECDIVKRRNDTVLRVAWDGDLRLVHSGPRPASCRRWYFTLNDKECAKPRAIDVQLRTNMEMVNLHYPHHVEGYCHGLSAGKVRIDWTVGDCVKQYPYYNVGDSYTGLASTVRIVVEELDIEDVTENII